MSDSGQTYVAELVAGLSLDASGMESGTTKAERAFQRMQNTFSQQKSKLEQTGQQIDALGIKIEKLKEKFNSFSVEKKFSAEGTKVQDEIDRLIERSDALVEQYGKEEDALARTAESLTELGYRVSGEAEREEAAAAKRQANQSYAETSLQITALTSSLRILGTQFGEAGDLISVLIQALILYRQKTLLAKQATDAQAAAEAAKNAAMTMGLSVLVTIAASAISQLMATNDATKQVTSSVGGLTDAYHDAIKSLEKNMKASKAEVLVLDSMIDRYDQLNNKASLSAQEQQELSAVVGQLQQVYGDLDWRLDETTGKWNVQTEAIRSNRDAMIANIDAQYAYDKATEAYKTKAKMVESFNKRYGEYFEEELTVENFEEKVQAKLDSLKKPKYDFFDSGNQFDPNDQSTYFVSDQRLFDRLTEKLEKTSELTADYNKWIDQIAKSETLGDAADTGAEKTKKEAEEAAENAKKATEKAEQEAEAAAKKLQDNFDDVAEAVTKALKSKYEAMRDAEQETLQASIDAWSQWADKNTAAIQEEIDKLDELEQKEENEQKTAELKQKADEIAYQLRFETDEYTRNELQKAYNAATAEYDEEVQRQEREALKASLQEQITAVNDAATEQQTLLQQKKDELSAKYDALLSNSSLEQETEKLFHGSQSAESIRALLEEYNPKYFYLGKSLGERIASELPTMAVTALVEEIQQYAGQALANASGIITQAANTSGSAAGSSKTITIGEINVVADSTNPEAAKQSMEDFAEYLANMLN